MADRRLQLGLVMLIVLPAAGFLLSLLNGPTAPKLLEGDPPRFLEAQALHRKNEVEAAKKIYDELAAIHLGSRCYAAVVGARLGGTATPTIALEKALLERPTDVHCLTLLGRELIYSGKPKEALSYLEKALAGAPLAGPVRGFVLASLGFQRFTTFQYEVAAKDFEAAAKEDPGIAMYAYNAGYAHFQYGNYAAAQPHLKRAIELGLEEDVRLAAADQLDIIERGATWICPMHPDERGKEGDICKLCGMKLEPVAAGVPLLR